MTAPDDRAYQIGGPWPPPRHPPMMVQAPADPAGTGRDPDGVESDRPEPRWGMPDIAIGVPVILIFATIGLVVGALLFGADETLVAESAAVATFAGLGQQLAQGGWPVFVARWKGNGVVRDFGLRFKGRDLILGPMLALGILITAASAGALVSTALGVQESDDVSNTSILTDNQDSPWFYAIVFMVVVGAPLSEELFFRGLVMRSIEKRFGAAIGVIGSTVAFVLPHYTYVAWRETLVIFVVIGIVGAALGIVVQRTGRLGIAIIAHSAFNSAAVLATFAPDV